MISANNIRKMSWTFLSVLVFFMVFGPSNARYFWYVYFGLVLLAVVWTLYLIYVCEKFTIYFISIIVAFFGAFSVLICSVAYAAATNYWGDASVASVVAGLAPVSVTLLTCLILAYGKPSFHPFEYDGLKVQTRYEYKQSPARSYNPVLIAGATTLAASITIKTIGMLAAGMISMLGLQAFCLAALFHARHILRGLRLLRIQEKSMPTPYTFMEIDGIREARGRWWTSRFFNWVASRCTSTDA